MGQNGCHALWYKYIFLIKKSDMIIAVKNGVQKTFSEHAWKLLGKTKNGWAEINGVQTVNTIKKEMPGTGTAEKPKPQVVENTVEKKTEEVKEKVENNVVTETIDVKEIFFNTIKEKAVTKTQIKDYLDSKEVTYKANDTLETLAGILFEQLGTVEKLTLEFSL